MRSAVFGGRPVLDRNVDEGVTQLFELRKWNYKNILIYSLGIIHFALKFYCNSRPCSEGWTDCCSEWVFVTMEANAHMEGRVLFRLGTSG
jgi:hypothetical protein